MSNRLTSLCLLAALLFMSTSTGRKQYRIVGYYTGWSQYDGRGNFLPQDIQAKYLTHIHYGFANVDESGSLVLGDVWGDTQNPIMTKPETDANVTLNGTFYVLNHYLKSKHPHLKTIISVGGWNWSVNFSSIAKSEEKRQVFAKSCAEFINAYGFDGVDIDWEYPVEGGLETNPRDPNDGINYTLLLQSIREAIGNKTLSIAGSGVPNHIRHLELSKMAEVVDYVNVMGYDYRGSFSSTTGHHAALYPSRMDVENGTVSASTAVDFYVQHGMPPEKINLGAAMYGRAWNVTRPEKGSNGLFQQFEGVPKGTWDKDETKTGEFDYDDIQARIEKGELEEHFDREAKAPWAFNPETGLMVSYDNEDSIEEKCSYIKTNALGGIMFWELGGDRKADLLEEAADECKSPWWAF